MHVNQVGLLRVSVVRMVGLLEGCGVTQLPSRQLLDAFGTSPEVARFDVMTAGRQVLQVAQTQPALRAEVQDVALRLAAPKGSTRWHA